ncbi:MAG: glycoside hydrolase family 43 protein [Tannerella sp.]|nr:glycoside hydrolase family 43 protein [Tannerella sp.]
MQGQNPIVQTMYTADPAPMIYQDTLFVFVGHDENDAPPNAYLMREYRVYSTVDMVNWTDHGAVLKTGEVSWSAGDASAAQCIERNGKFYFYISTQNNTPGSGGVSVGVMVSDHIDGPYKDVLGKALVTNQMTTFARHSWDDLDPTVFIDDDGQAYLYWGNGACYRAKLNEDMVSLAGPVIPLNVRDQSAFGVSFTEAPWVYKRNGMYYMIYASGFPESIHYTTASEPEGPWTYRGVVMPLEGGSNTNHPGIIDYKGHSYFFYHNDKLPGGHSYQRSVCVEQFEYNADGTIPQMTMTDGIAKGVGVLNPYVRTEAETIAYAEGVRVEGQKCTGIYVTSIHDGDYIKVRNVDFGIKGASGFSACTSSRYFGGTIELRLDGLDGKIIGTLHTSYTGEWDRRIVESVEISGATGVHDLFLVFKGRTPHELFHFDYWMFSE